MPIDDLKLAVSDEEWSEMGQFPQCGVAVVLFLLIWLIFSWPWQSSAGTIPWGAKAHFALFSVFCSMSCNNG